MKNAKPGTRVGGFIVCADGKRRKPRTLLEMVKERITARPQDYDQTGWDIPGCIAAHLCRITGASREPNDIELLITCESDPWLFRAVIPNFRDATHGASPKARAAAACRAIDAFIKERGL